MLPRHIRAASVIVFASVCTATSMASVTVSGYIADPYTSFAPFSGALGQYGKTGGGTLQDGVIYSDFGPNRPSRYGTAISGGGPGFVNSYTYSQYIQNNGDGSPGSYFIRSSGGVEATWTDVVVSGPAGGPATVPVSVNLLVHGSYLFNSTTVVDPHNVGWTQYSSASCGVWINDQPVGSGNWGVRSDSGAPVVTPLANGFFQNFNGTFQGATNTVEVPVNTPFSVKMFLLSTAEVYVPAGGSLNLAANCDFAHTASFDTSGPAFNVPAGYTVNSAEAGVSDNTFFLVPSPSALATLACAGLFTARRRR